MKLRTVIACACTLFFAAGAYAVPASAAGSVEDVLDAMRRVGFPENVVQNARVQYEAMDHDENGVTLPQQDGTEQYITYDDLAMYVEVFEQEYLWGILAQQMGVSEEELKEAYSTLPASEPDPGSGSTETTPADKPFTPSVEPEKPFAAMSLDEKRAYIQSLPEDERAAFLVTLSPLELRSIYRDADTDQKASLAQGIAEIGSGIGMNVSVDQADADGVSLSIRSGDGVLIDNTALGGAAVDNTGWDLRLPIFGSAAAILLALGGFAATAACEGRRQKREEQHHG